MNKPIPLSIDLIGSTVHLTGEFTFDSIVDALPIWQKVALTILNTQEMIVQCEQVTKADSSFFALLIEMRRWAHKHDCRWQLKQLPKSLEGFLMAYGLSELLTSPKLI